MSKGGRFFVRSRHILPLFIFQFAYLCLYFSCLEKCFSSLFIFIFLVVGKTLLENWMSMWLYEKSVWLCWDSTFHVIGSQQIKQLHLVSHIIRRTDFIKKTFGKPGSQQVVPFHQSRAIFSYNQPLNSHRDLLTQFFSLVVYVAKLTISA